MVETNRYDFDLQGHNNARKLFLEAFHANQLHHAWLISGPRGIGKASLACQMIRFLLNHDPVVLSEDLKLSFETEDLTGCCSLRTDLDSPDNRLISSGSHPDLMTIKRGIDPRTGHERSEIIIDEIRLLKDFFTKTSDRGGMRIALIDSVDDLNNNGANALLKFLEEPPEKTILILISHVPGLLLPTLKSRCRQLKLTPLSFEVVRDILLKSHPDLGEEMISALACLSEGCPGYAFRLIENQGVDLYGKLLELLSSCKNWDVPLTHKLTSQVLLKQNEQHDKLLCELIGLFISRLVRYSVQDKAIDQVYLKEILQGEFDLMNKLIQAISLDQWVDLWEKIGYRSRLIHIDRKQLVLSILNLIHQKLYQEF